MLAMIKKQLIQVGILLGVLSIVMVLGGMIEGGLSILTGLGALALLAALLYGLICVLDACSHPARSAGAAQAPRQESVCDAQHPEGLRVA